VTMMTGARTDGRALTEMPVPEPSPSFKRLLRASVFGIRAGLSGGLAVASADAASLCASGRYAWLVYAVTGGTMAMLFWWVFGRILKRVGVTAE
jgi:hypothetical protein